MKYEKPGSSPTPSKEIEVNQGTSEARVDEVITEVKPPEIKTPTQYSKSRNPEGGPIEVDNEKKDKIYQLIAQGIPLEDIARVEEVCLSTVQRVGDRLAKDQDMTSFKKGYAKMLLSGGVISTRKLIDKLNGVEGDRANIGSLAVVSGILTQRGLETLNNTQEPEVKIDWTDLLGA